MHLSVGCDRDRVILALPARARDVSFRPDDADQLADAIDAAVRHCQAWVTAGGARHVLTGELIDGNVASWDGLVHVRFSKVLDRLPMQFLEARQFSKIIRAKAVEARQRVTFKLATPNAENGHGIGRV